MLTAFDTETTGLALYRGDKVFAFSECDPDTGEGNVYRDDTPNFAGKMESLFLGEDPRLLMHNAKFDLTAVCQFFGGSDATRELFLDTPFHDTMLMAAIVRNDATKSLKPLAWEICGFPQDDAAAIKAFLRGGTDYSQVPAELMTPYQLADVQRTSILYHYFWPKIKGNAANLWNYQLERALIVPTIRMESYGMRLIPKAVDRLLTWLEKEVGDARAAIPRWCNPKSSVNVRKWLFTDGEDCLNLPPRKVSKKTKEASADKTVLAELLGDLKLMAGMGDSDAVAATHAIRSLEALAKHRSYSVGKTMVEKYRDLADVYMHVHPTLNTHQAVTGRESSQDPNLQNVAKPGKAANPYEVPARACFAPKLGHVNFHVDYAGIEIVLAIQASKEPEMIDLLHRRTQERYPNSLDPRIDPHALASSVFYPEYAGLDKSEMKIKRGAAKNGQFCIVYGGGDKKLAMTLVLPWHLGKPAAARYKMRFPKIMGLGAALHAELKAAGYITNSFGKKLYMTREKAHAAVNYYIQSDAAIILKIAQVRVDALLRKLTGDRWRLVLPIHDELIISAPREDLRYAPEILQQVRQVMIQIEQMVVPLEVEFGISTASWNQVQEYDIWKGLVAA